MVVHLLLLKGSMTRPYILAASLPKARPSHFVSKSRQKSTHIKAKIFQSEKVFQRFIELSISA